VTVQTPLSSLVIGYVRPSSSPISVTCFALGARKRKVTVLSGFTSGETSCGPRPPPRGPVAGGCGAGAPACPAPAAPGVCPSSVIASNASATKAYPVLRHM
jgi:hypothetical protein